MNESPEEIIRRELHSSETLLWAGRPRQGYLLRPLDALMIPFSILWGGFAIFWEIGVITTGAPWFFALWGIPFVLAGLYIMIGRFWIDRRQRTATVYGVTSERVVFVSGLFFRTVKSLNLDTLTNMTLSERTSGGTITFGQMPYWPNWITVNWWDPSQQGAPHFELADNAREVYETVRNARRATNE